MGGRTILSDDEDEYVEEDGGDIQDNEAADVDERQDRHDDDDDEEEEGQDEYEKDGFIVDDVEEEEDGEEEERENSDEERHKKRKKKRRDSEKNYELDEDDYDLLEDNNITGFHRPKPGSKKFKRLKKAGRDTEHEERSGFSDEEEVDEVGQGGRTAEEKLKRSLFGDDEGGAFEDIAEEEEQPEEEEDVDMGEEDEMADFIVDEEEVDENGLPVRRKKPKKRIPRQAAGVSSTAWQEAHHIFGDVDELLTLRKQARNEGYADSVDKRLEDEFEPGVLAAKYMTEKDKEIQEIDTPERIQLFEEITGPVPKDDESIQAESTWIYNQLVASAISPMFEKERAIKVTKDIGNVLGMLHVQKFDIPFIAMYRKELCLSLLKDPDRDTTEIDERDKTEKAPTLKWHKVLWAIQNLDKKWLLLQKRRNALQLYYNKRAAEEAYMDLSKKMLLDSLLESLKDAESERDIDDIDSKFNLHFPPDEADPEEGQFKRPKRKSIYSICRKAGLGGAASKFGFSPEQLGKRLNLEQMGEQLEDARDTPEDVATGFVCPEFETSQDVLKGARYMAAVDISCDPLVRKHIRNAYMDKGVISTRPTPDGNATIDSFHQFSSVKWLRDKPISLFNDAQWLLIQKAEEEKLLQVTIRIPETGGDQSLIQEFEEKYLSDGVSKAAQVWNEQRKLILKEALFNYLIPLVEKEVRSLLTVRAKSWLRTEFGTKLWRKVSVAPYQRKEDVGHHRDMDSDVGSDDDVAPRVMACCWGPGKPATTFVMLDSSGEVLDVLYTPYITVRSKSLTPQQRKKNDQQRIMKFMTDHQPHVVVLGAASLSCRPLNADIFEIIFKMVEDHPREVGQDMDNIQVVYGDESLPRLYENSRISSDQLPGQPAIVRRAVALGRYLQNPLAMTATLCGPGKEILSLKLHHLEHFLGPDERYEVIEQVMIDATNQVGVDINLAACHEWLFAPLQFVSGLGPRKASSLQRAIINAGRVYSRKEIPMNLGVLKRNVFINAAGFLRVRASGQAASGSQIMDLLDDTRIHPESYELAQKMAKDVYAAEEDEDVAEMDEEAQEMAIEHVRNNPKLLRVLDIDEYAKSTEERVGTRKLETLYDIKMELLHGFQDWRQLHNEITPDELFYMISGETEETLAEGRVVQATVKRVLSHRVICELESGLMGLILAEEFSDDNIEVTEGSVLPCKIKAIQKARYQVLLTCKEKELRNTGMPNRRLDPYYVEDEGNLQSENDKVRKEKELAKKSFKPRMIVHPRFQNLTADEAMEFLADKEPGETIIRPSSRGPSHLTLTLKVYDGIYAHKDMSESGKDHKDITSLLRLGKTLTIGDDTFEDLDEVMDRYVDPLVANLKTMLSYRKFKKGSKTEVDDLLRVEKSEYPMRIVYCFGVSHEHPGTFILSYIRSANPHHEYISLYPKGFKFRKRMFDNLDRLVAYFQKHIDDLPNDVPSIRSVAAIVMRSPATGGSSGGSWGGSAANSTDGGWRVSDRDRSSTPGSRTGRNDHRSGSGRSNHPSGLPRPYGRGRGMHSGRGSSGGEGLNSRFDSKWAQSPGSKDDDGGWSSFPGAKIQNSPGREAFGGWGGGSSWGGGSGNRDGGGDDNGGGWGGGGSGSRGGGGGNNGGGWGGGGGGGGDSGGDWGGGSKGVLGQGRGNFTESGNGWKDSGGAWD